MEPNLHEYPYTSYEDGCNMGCFMGMCHRAGVKLAVVGDSLQLLDKNNFVLSQVKIAIAQSALKDELGNNITAYIINAGAREDTVVFTKGNGDEIVVTVPFATTARYDKSGNEIDDYIIDVQAVGDNLAITRGDGVTYTVTCPYATKAFTDVNNKPLTTYAASMEVSGNNVILKDGMGTVISTITVHFAERAAADENGNNIRESYAAVLQAGTTTVKLIAKSGDILSEITVPYSTSSLKDTNGNEFLKDYAESLVIDNDGKRLDLLAHDGTLLSSITVPFSTLSTDATNAIERAEIVGDQLVLTTYAGVVTRLTIPYAIRSLNDGDSNEITKTYVHNVVQDPVTGEITFYDAEGTALCALTPRARIAEYDTYNNLIADYIKTLVFDNQSDYLVATHGDGTTDTIVVNYATKAWKDTQGNIIKNTYVAFLANVVDNEGEWVLVAYNGEGSEIFRLKVVANKAQKDQLGNVIDTFYAHGLFISGYELALTDAHSNVIGSVITLPKDARTIDFVQNTVTPNEFDLNLKDADGNNTDSHWMSAYIDNNTDLVLFDIGNNNEVFRVTLPSLDLFTKNELSEAPIYLIVYNSLLSERPTIIDIMKDANTIKGRMYIYTEEQSFGTNEFTAEIADNISIAGNSSGVIPINYYNMTSANVNRDLLANKVSKDIRRTGGGIDPLYYNAIISNDAKPNYRAGYWYGTNLRTVSLDDNSWGNYGSSGLSGNSVDLLVSNRSNAALSKSSGDLIHLYQNIYKVAKSHIEFYNTDDMPFINLILKAGGSYTITGGNIHSARLTTYKEDGTVLEQKTFNNLENELVVSDRATDTGESSAIKIEISNQDTFAEFQYGYFEVYDQHNAYTTLDLS